MPLSVIMVLVFLGTALGLFALMYTVSAIAVAILQAMSHRIELMPISSHFLLS